MRKPKDAETKRLRKSVQPKRSALPPLIDSTEALEAHIAALCQIEPHFGKLHAVAGEIPLRFTDKGYRGLFHVIMGQQISAAAGRAIFARAEAALGTISADRVAEVDDALLTGAGLSMPKVRTLRAISAAILAGELDLDGLSDMQAEDAIAHLSAIKGIGRWTAECYLLFALGHPDIFPAGDLALKEGIRMGFELEERPAEKALVSRAEAWTPHRSAAARLTWAYYGAVKRGGANVAPA